MIKLPSVLAMVLNFKVTWSSGVKTYFMMLSRSSYDRSEKFFGALSSEEASVSEVVGPDDRVLRPAPAIANIGCDGELILIS